nr:hypothetical protein [Tanacetum cinerariifolium]
MKELVAYQGFWMSPQSSLLPQVILEWGDEDDENNDAENDDNDGDADDEGDDHVSDKQDAEDEDEEVELDENDIYKYKIRVRTDEFEVVESKKYEEEITDAAKTVAEKKEVEKKQMLVLCWIFPSSKKLFISNHHKYRRRCISKGNAETTAYLKYKYSLQHLPELTTKLIPTVDLEKESEKSPSKNLQIKKEHAEKQQTPKFTIKYIDKATLREYDLKSDLYQSMNANKSFNINPANYRLYHKLMEAFVEDENARDKGVANMVQDHKRKRDDDDDDDDDEGPLVGPNQGKQAKRIRTKGSESSMKPSTTKETPKSKPPYKGSKTGKQVFKENVYSTKAILGVKSVSVKKFHGYGHLEEIRRSLILKRRVEDLQLDVEGYLNKLNITAPQKTYPDIKCKEPYTPSYDPPGIVYKDLNKQKRVIQNQRDLPWDNPLVSVEVL